MGLANLQWWICHEDMPRILQCSSIICVENLPLCDKSGSRVSYSDISTSILPRLSYCYIWLADMQYSIWHNKSHDICRRDSGAHESGWISLYHSNYVAGFRLLGHLKFATDEWLKPFATWFSQFNSCHVSFNRSATRTSNVLYQFTLSHMVINNK